MTYVDVVSRISAIQEQLGSLQSAFVAPTQSTGVSPTSTASATASLPPTSFASTLSGAMASDTSLSTGATASTTALPGGASTTALPGGASTTALPGGASTMLTSAQQQFAARLAADTGLDPGVVSAWLLAEESGSAAVSRQSAGNNDWLNIGYTDGGTFGSGDSIWSNPVTAADATAGWLKGQNTIPGYGTASSGVQAILSTAGQSAQTQIAALQSSGWASSGYPDLPSLYAQLSG